MCHRVCRSRLRQLEKDAPALRAPVLDASPESAAAPAGAGFVGQLLCLAKREKDLLLRDTVGLIAMVLAPALLNLLFAFIFFQAFDRYIHRYLLPVCNGM